MVYVDPGVADLKDLSNFPPPLDGRRFPQRRPSGTSFWGVTSLSRRNGGGGTGARTGGNGGRDKKP